MVQYNSNEMHMNTVYTNQLSYKLYTFKHQVDKQHQLCTVKHSEKMNNINHQRNKQHKIRAARHQNNKQHN